MEEPVPTQEQQSGTGFQPSIFPLSSKFIVHKRLERFVVKLGISGIVSPEEIDQLMADKFE